MRSIGRTIAREAIRSANRAATYSHLQRQTASLPGARKVQMSGGSVWMSAIEFQLYEAMRREGLSPVPQYRISGYYVDFAFPDIWFAVEADGAAYHSGARRQHDQKRDWILRRAGWTVKRFHGTTIYHRAENRA